MSTACFNRVGDVVRSPKPRVRCLGVFNFSEAFVSLKEAVLAIPGQDSKGWGAVHTDRRCRSDEQLLHIHFEIRFDSNHMHYFMRAHTPAGKLPQNPQLH